MVTNGPWLYVWISTSKTNRHSKTSGGPFGPPFFYQDMQRVSQSSQVFYKEISALLRDDQADVAVERLQDWLADNPDDEVGTSMYGSALMRAGHQDDAIDVFRTAATAHAESFAAQGDLGFALAQSGARDKAIVALGRAVGLNRNFYPGFVFLSRLYFEAGDLAAARRAFEGSEKCDPFASEVPRLQKLMNSDNFAKAEKTCRALLNREPGYPRAAYTLAHLASNVGAFEEASQILQQAIKFYPADINLRSALVVSLEESGEFHEAVKVAVSMTDLDPENPAAWLILGRVHGHCGNYDDCLVTYNKALELSADNGEIGNTEMLRGHILKILGRYDEGIAAYCASADKINGNGAAWWGLADMKTHRFDDADIAKMRIIADDKSIKQEQRTQAAFALGKAYEDRQDFDTSFGWYDLGNKLRTGIDFDPAAQRAGIDTVCKAYSAEVLSRQAVSLPDSPIPIFILGLPRSGSTLIEQILASHSRIEGTMELVNMPNLVRRITIDGGRRNEDYPASIASFSHDELAAYGQKYIDETAMYRTDKPFFIDKLPTNFDKVGLIHKILPQAIVIDARRDAMDCGFSCYKQHFAGGHMFSYDLENIAVYYNSYLKLMRHWDDVLPGKIFLTQYEDTVENTESTIRALLNHCGVEFEEACLRFFENKRPVRTASSEQVRQPIYNKGVGYWRKFESHLKPLEAALKTS